MRLTILVVSILWISLDGLALDFSTGLSQKSDSLIRYLATNPSTQDINA